MRYELRAVSPFILQSPTLEVVFILFITRENKCNVLK